MPFQNYANQLRKLALPAVFSRLGYTQSFALVDTKLIIGYSIVAVAAISFLIDKKIAWDDSILYQKILVGLYFVFCAVFWYFNKFIEKGTTYQGVKKSDHITVKTKFQPYTPVFKATFADNHGNSLTTELSSTKVFNEEGYLQFDLLYKWFQDQVEILQTKKQD